LSQVELGLGFDNYLENMQRVFRLTRRIHPTTGAKIEYDDAEKKDLILVEEGEDMQNLFKHVGLVVYTLLGEKDALSMVGG